MVMLVVIDFFTKVGDLGMCLGIERIDSGFGIDSRMSGFGILNPKPTRNPNRGSRFRLQGCTGLQASRPSDSLINCMTLMP